MMKLALMRPAKGKEDPELPLLQDGLPSGAESLHLSARGVTTDKLVRIQAVSQPAVIGRAHRAAHNWPSIVRIWPV